MVARDGIAEKNAEAHVVPMVMVTTTKKKRRMGSWFGASVASPVMYLVVNSCGESEGRKLVLLALNAHCMHAKHGGGIPAR